MIIKGDAAELVKYMFLLNEKISENKKIEAINITDDFLSVADSAVFVIKHFEEQTPEPIKIALNDILTHAHEMCNFLRELYEETLQTREEEI